MSAFKENQKVHLVFSSTALYMCEECKKGRFLFFIEDVFFNSPHNNIFLNISVDLILQTWHKDKI